MNATQLAPIAADLRSFDSARIAAVAAYSLFALALGVTAIHAIRVADASFTGPHAFVSADVATTARTFANQGIFKLHGVPVNNNAPIGLGDQYTHWPPLLPIMLSLCFRSFGASELTARLFMLAVLVCTSLLIVRLGSLWLGPFAGALAGYFWLTLPVVAQLGDLIAQQSLAILFVVAAALAFFSRRDVLGAALLFVGVLSSWEAILIVPGIWLASCRFPTFRRSTSMAAVGAGAAFLCVVALFTFGSPGLAADTLQTVKFYMGLSPVYSHLLPHDRAQLSFAAQVSGILWNHLWMLGALGVAALVQLLTMRPRDGALIVSTLAAPWIIWTAFMRTHVAVHDFELLIAAPLAALALAWLATAEFRKLPSGNAALKAGLVAGLAAVQLTILPIFRPVERLIYSPERIIDYGREIRLYTPPGSIILAPLESSVPVYYSERHIVRGVDDSAALLAALPELRRAFPGASTYLAIPPVLTDNFTAALSRAEIISSNPNIIVAKILQP
jgi:hypothetical protein